MKKWIAGTLFLALIAGCSESNSEEDARLARFKSALPSTEALSAPTGTQDASTRAVGDVALFPASSVDIVQGINGTVAWVVTVLDFVTNFEPTFYNSETREYVWGPFENDDGVGFVSVYIKENDPGSEFQYTYGFVRGATRDLANTAVVIAGGGTPLDPENDDPNTVDDNEFGQGVLFVDFDADLAFDLENDPTTDVGERDRGKFVAVFGKNADEEDPDATLSSVVAAFRNFVPAGETAEPTDLDYLYGVYETDEWKADFLNYRLGIEIDENTSAREDTEVQLAFVNDGIGRAEVLATGGSLGAGESITAIECWGEDFDRTYLDIQTNVDGGYTYIEGSEAGCFAPFNQPLGNLDIPSLADIAEEDFAEIANIAENGLVD
ncbi:MAG: hypothetical protein AAF658_08845 [Myxococcota bacterium]